MMWIAIAAGLSGAQPAIEERVAAQRQARAVVRILRPVTVRLGEPGGAKAEGATIRSSRVRERDDSEQQSTFLEFY